MAAMSIFRFPAPRPTSRRLAVALLAVAPLAAPPAAAVEVAATVPPLRFIAEAVLDGAGAAGAVIDGQGSAHHFTLSPSGRLALARADAVLWIGPDFEAPLAGLIGRLAADRPVVTASALPGVDALSLPDGRTDPHLWLDADSAARIAEALAEELSRLRPERAALWRSNAERFAAKARRTRRAAAARLAGGSRGAPYVVAHDAYRYFERQFGLDHALALLRDPDAPPGMRRTLALRARIGEIRPGCVIVEPDTDPALVARLLGGTPARVVEVDPAGLGIAPGADAWFRLMAEVADGFERCLAGAGGAAG